MEQPVWSNDSADIHNHLQFIQHLRADAASTSKGAEEKMVQKSSSANPPASYSLGEEVMVRKVKCINFEKKSFQGQVDEIYSRNGERFQSKDVML